MYEVLITDMSLRSKTKSNMINVIYSINNNQKQSTLSMITVISTQGMKWYACIYKSILSQFEIGTSYCKLSYKWNIIYNFIHIYWKYSLQKLLNVYDYIQQNISRIQEHITLSDQLYCKH